MPELPEVERYRRLAEAAALRRPIRAVDAPDRWYLKRGADPASVSAALIGRELASARRIGKLLLLDLDGPGGPGPTLGLHFGMSGRLVVDDRAGVDDLLYTSNDDRGRWNRFSILFADGGHLRMLDPRRLGGVEIDPDESRLGPDAATVGPAALRRILATSNSAVKARLLDQSAIAGVGNLIADEALWRAGVDPRAPAASLAERDVRRLHHHLRRTIDDLVARGGSHTGDLLAHRAPGGRCPRDGEALRRGVVGGRTTWWCPAHQR